MVLAITRGGEVLSKDQHKMWILAASSRERLGEVRPYRLSDRKLFY